MKNYLSPSDLATDPSPIVDQTERLSHQRLFWSFAATFPLAVECVRFQEPEDELDIVAALPQRAVTEAADLAFEHPAVEITTEKGDRNAVAGKGEDRFCFSHRTLVRQERGRMPREDRCCFQARRGGAPGESMGSEGLEPPATCV